MKNTVICLLLICFCGLLRAHDHSIGLHGMVLFTIDDRIYASHLPLPQGKHAVQLIFEAQIPAQYKTQLMSFLKAHELVTVRPETFSLNQLRNGQITKFKGDIYIGHFERSGKVKHTGIAFNVQNTILNEPVSTSQRNGQFYVLGLGNSTCLLVHKIGHTPSYDQIAKAHCDYHAGQTAEINCSTIGPVKSFKLADFLNAKTLYLETKDFK
ncbi:hypothetical protein N474_01140 [Pseudoalteromonas luteoviolacea CPMOR-2]|uniref:Uncharacterized protein n=1 Tax=Pseudoalteromonas luteoviolacea DSM 6061 TaxID=1365250 RepID=A0A166WWU8_9GAMM|nr:hypothetical protein [Pseudoalteromonas luteoviolacea]KZN38170.1 hypothetical protein N475_16195 [Pseudoalteromonas luteoviolacea DSM 6061]KZN54345.1 hypothetical protein N474_01140 [Pseudoalteromonas luteoviolacea CPMOR-2]MBE0388800.1 hypothetical protein [Pseudoalteromonas luteoviolacea DSM 6061]